MLVITSEISFLVAKVCSLSDPNKAPKRENSSLLITSETVSNLISHGEHIFIRKSGASLTPIKPQSPGAAGVFWEHTTLSPGQLGRWAQAWESDGPNDSSSTPSPSYELCSRMHASNYLLRGRWHEHGLEGLNLLSTAVERQTIRKSRHRPNG